MKKKTFIGLATLSILSTVGLTQFSSSIDAATIEDVKAELRKIEEKYEIPEVVNPDVWSKLGREKSDYIRGKIYEIGKRELLESLDKLEISPDEVLEELKLYNTENNSSSVTNAESNKLSDEDLLKLKSAMEYEKVSRAETAVYDSLKKDKIMLDSFAHQMLEIETYNRNIANITKKLRINKEKLELLKAHLNRPIAVYGSDELNQLEEELHNLTEKNVEISNEIVSNYYSLFYTKQWLAEFVDKIGEKNPEFKKAFASYSDAKKEVESKKNSEIPKDERINSLIVEANEIKEILNVTTKRTVGIRDKLNEVLAEISQLNNKPFGVNSVEPPVHRVREFSHGVNGAEAAINEVPEFDLSTLKPQETPTEPSQEKPNITPTISEVKPELKPEVPAIVEKEEAPKKEETVSSWKRENGKWYRYDKEGKKQTGWVQDGSWYYLNSKGEMQTGWLLKDNTWYYLNNSGAMEKGWNEVDGKWYFMNQSGAMEKGWVEVSGKWYFMNQSGAMQTGWVQVSGKWYYFNQSGELLTNTKTPDGYYVNANGEWG